MDAQVIFNVQRTDRPVTLDDWRDAVENYFDDAQGLISGPGKVLGGAKLAKQTLGILTARKCMFDRISLLNRKHAKLKP